MSIIETRHRWFFSRIGWTLSLIHSLSFSGPLFKLTHCTIATISARVICRITLCQSLTVVKLTWSENFLLSLITGALPWLHILSTLISDDHSLNYLLATSVSISTQLVYVHQRNFIAASDQVMLSLKIFWRDEFFLLSAFKSSPVWANSWLYPFFLENRKS